MADCISAARMSKITGAISSVLQNTSDGNSRNKSGAVGDLMWGLLDQIRGCVALGDCFFFQAEDGIRDLTVTGVQTCSLPISIVFQMNLRQLEEKLADLYVQQGVMSEARPLFLQLAEIHLKNNRQPEAVGLLKKLDRKSVV